jgi:hypothetical protein
MKIAPVVRPLLAGNCVSDAMIALAWTVMHKELYSVVSSRLIALEQLLVCVAVMVVSAGWENIQGWMTRHFVAIELWESVLNTAFCVWFLFKWNPYVYFVADLLYFVILGSVLVKTASTCYTKLFKESQDRVNADSAFEFFGSLARITGFGVGVFFSPGIKTCVVLFMVGDLVRTVGRIWTFREKKEPEDMELAA